MARSYDYSPAARALEIASIAVLLGYLVRIAIDTLADLSGPARAQAWWILAIFPLLAVLAADFVSGLVHFLADRFGTPRTPLVGRHFVKPFREHHVDPEGITRHDFIEANGNNSIVTIPVVAGCYHLLPRGEAVWAAVGELSLGSFVLAIFFTNQFHQWAHTAQPPAWVAALQRLRLILPRPQHQIHHTPPYDRYYCITTGWLNAPLQRIGFFPWAERTIRAGLGRWAGLPPEEQMSTASFSGRRLRS